MAYWSQENVVHSEGTFQGARGLSIYYQCWTPDGAPRALVIIAHGAAEHGGRYAGLADYLNARGYAVAALDHAGHGRSEGTPGFVQNFDDFIEDLRRFRQELSGVASGTPRILLGHSMGGLIATNYLLRYQDDFAVCALSGPAIATDLQPGALQLFMVKLLSALLPKMGALQLDAEGVSRDPEEVARYEADPLVFRGKMSARLVAELFRAMSAVQQRAAEISLPMLIMHGAEDSMTAPAGSQLLANAISSDDKTLKIYPKLYHEIFNEPEKDEVMNDLLQWLDERVATA